VTTAKRAGGAPSRVLTDWTTVAGLDGAGLLALVTAGATAEGIHLATLGYEVFVLHVDAADAEAAEEAAHVHHVGVDVAALPVEWNQRFALIVALDGVVPVGALAPQGLVVAIADTAIEVSGLTQVRAEEVDDDGAMRVRTVLADLR